MINILSLFQEEQSNVGSLYAETIAVKAVDKTQRILSARHRPRQQQAKRPAFKTLRDPPSFLALYTGTGKQTTNQTFRGDFIKYVLFKGNYVMTYHVLENFYFGNFLLENFCFKQFPMNKTKGTPVQNMTQGYKNKPCNYIKSLEKIWFREMNSPF